MKTIVVTGAGSGIGRATALHFATKGWFVGLFDLNGSAVESLAQSIGPERCFGAAMDVCDDDSVARGIERFATENDGVIDVLFNNAGILAAGFLDELSLAEQMRVVDVNLKGLISCTYHTLPYLKKAQSGRVINMSSASAFYGTAHLAVYSATKAAVSSLTESLNMELESAGIHVCDIRVPYVATPLLETEIKAASLENMGANLAPEDVAAMVYRALDSRKLHHDDIHLFPMLILKRLLPMCLQRPILKRVMMPR